MTPDQRSYRDVRVVSKAMRRVRSQSTAPELLLRKALWKRGLRFRLQNKHVAGKPDIVLPRTRLAVFVDGDYWHGNQWLRRGHPSLEAQFAQVHGREYWVTKIRRTMERDRQTTAALLRAGWRVLRLWESQVIADLPSCIELAASPAAEDVDRAAVAALAERRFAEFFAGIGLVRLALEGQGWSPALANDIDPQKYEMYAAHFGSEPDERFRLADIHALTADDIPTVGLATASFPCTDLSLAGARLGLAGPQSGSIFGFLRLMRELGDRRPPLILLENVPGFLTSHGGEDIKAVLRAMNELGYLVDAFVIDARHFVPQSRVRLFVVGAHRSIPNLPHRPLDDSAPALRPASLLTFIRSTPDILWRHQPLPALPLRTTNLSDILEDLPPDDPMWWSPERSAYLLNQMSPRHRNLADDLIARDQTSYGTVFRRVRHGRSMAELRVDEIAGCLRTPKGGSGRQILFRAGQGAYAARLLTARECARLMGAPDFKIDAPLNQALFGLGDAVCVPVLRWIAEHYLNVVVTQAIHGTVMSSDHWPDHSAAREA